MEPGRDAEREITGGRSYGCRRKMLHLLGVVGKNVGLAAVVPALIENTSSLPPALAKIWRTSIASASEPIEDPMTRLREATVADSTLHPPAKQAAIKLWVDKIAAASSRGDQGKVKELYVELETLIKRNPTQAVNISHQEEGGDTAKLKALDETIENLIASYPPDIHDLLSAFIGQARANCYLESPTRAQIYCYGDPGTGKTRFAKLLANTLGLPLMTIAVDPDNAREFVDGKLFAEGKLSDPTSWPSLIGHLPAALIKAGVVNPVIFIDEIGNSLGDYRVQDMLKIILDPNARALRPRALDGAEIDFSQAILILAGNVPITDAALKSRLPQIHFGKLELSVKWQNAMTYVNQQLEKQSRLNAASRARIAERVHDHVSDIMREDFARGVQGMRVIEQACDRLICHMRECVLRNKEPDDPSRMPSGHPPERHARLTTLVRV